MYEELKKAVCQANLELKRQRLVTYSWGNVSGIDRRTGIVVIKPSGVPYDQLSPDKMVLVDMTGKIIAPALRPSSDTPTHLELYRSFPSVGGICHTHSPEATAWAQACREIPCLGTTHADFFYGPVPVTASLTEEEIKGGYEVNTGKVIARRFTDIDPGDMPAVLVANHGPFTWGRNCHKAVESAVVLEHLARMALQTLVINQGQPEISKALLEKHYLRKHGKDAYYGQPQ